MTKTQKKIDENNHVCGLDLLGSGGSFRELECGAYLVCYFVQFFFFFFIEIEVVFVHLVLQVDFSFGCTKVSKAVLVWLEQSQ